MLDENTSKLNKTENFRIIVMNDDTFKEIKSFRYSRTKLLITIFGGLFGIALIIWGSMALTPLRNILFGFGDIKLRNQMEANQKHVDSLQGALADINLYIANMQKVFTGELKKSDSMQLIHNNRAMNSSSETIENSDNQDTTKGSSLNSNSEFAVNDNSKLEFSEELFHKNLDLSRIHFSPPLKGYISQEFNPGKKHYGTDITAPKNTPVKSVLGGYVILSDWTLNTGNVIGIQHNGDLVSFYKHNSQLLKKVGTFVKAGETIAIIGNTGELSDGPHLHFELWHNGQPVNPTSYINF